MTPRQRDLLAFLRKFWADNGHSPSYDEMMRGLGLKSKSNVHWLVDQLTVRGYIERDVGRRRSLRIVEGK